MAAPLTVILSNGGLSSLVTAGRTFCPPGSSQAVFLQVNDGRVMAKLRRVYVQKQGEHFGAQQVIEIQPLKLAKPEVA